MSGDPWKRRAILAKGTLDQYFTRSVHLQHYAKVIAKHCPECVFVDCSCGTGELGLLLFKKGFVVNMYDIDDSKLLSTVRENLCEDFTFTKKDWFDVKEIPFDSIVGFNPPFGANGTMSKKFALHGLALKCTKLCWLSSHIRGCRSRPWVPKDFVMIRHEIVPANAFVFKGKFATVPCDFKIFEKYPAAHTALVQQWQDEDARSLPNGYAIEYLSKILRKDRATLQECPQSAGALILRNSGENCGSSAMQWTPRGFQEIRSDGSHKMLNQDKEFNVKICYYLNLPSRYHGDKRINFIQQAVPIFKKQRRIAAQKRSINLYDMRTAIFQIK